MRKLLLLRSVVTLQVSFTILAIAILQPARAAAGDEQPAALERVRIVAVPDTRLGDAAQVLQHRIEEADFEDVPLGQILDWLAEVAELNLVVRYQTLEDAGVERHKPLSVHLRNLKLHQVLWIVLEEASGPDLDLAYEILGDNLVVVSTAEDLDCELHVRIYDVRSLLAASATWHYQRAEIAARRAAERSRIRMSGTESDADQPKRASCACRGDPPVGDSRAPHPWELDDWPHVEQELVDLLSFTVAPDSWAANGGIGTAECLSGMLAVRQSRSVHRQTEALLNVLLEAGAAETDQ